MAARSPLILVPPSEAKAPGGNGAPWEPGTCSFPALDDDRAAVLAALGNGVAAAPAEPAMRRYTGVLYKELDWASLPSAAKLRGGASVLVVSGLWGVVGPRDPIPYYKLKMSASLPGLGRLSSWWRPRLTAALAEAATGRVVWDLLPNEHRAAVDLGGLGARRVLHVRIVDPEGRTVGHWNKLIKGSLVRRLLVDGADPAALDGWVHPSGNRVEIEEES